MSNQQRPDACLGCFKPFRPNKARAADYPGTLAHYGLGRCRTCREALWHNGPAGDQDSTKTTEENRRNVERWLASHWRPSKTVKVVRL